MGARTTPVGLEQRLLVRAKEAGFGDGDLMVVAFSGGRDSLALASALRRVRDALGMRLLLVHVDHRLRAASGEEVDRAAELARALELDFLAVAVAANPRENHPGVGIEEAARRERYRLLFEAADARGARAVATGHHEQDQAETVLLHLLRGGGLHGAVGMGERTAAPTPPAGTGDISLEMDAPWLWRPLLRESRREIEAYVDLLGLEWVEDSSNADLSLRRNAVRHRILPMLESEFPGATAALARYARLAAADDEALEQTAGSVIAGRVDSGGRLEVGALVGQSLAVQRRLVRRWFVAHTGWRELTAERTDAILDLAIAGGKHRVIEAGGGWTVSLEPGMLRARRIEGDEQGGPVNDEPRADGVARILIDAQQIRERTIELARVLDEEYGSDVPLLVGVLNGAVAFMTDLMRAMTIPLEIDFMAVSSYGAATQSSGVVRILKDLDREIEGRRILVVEDIVDSGLTLQYLLDVLRTRNPRDIRVVALLKKEKPDTLEVPVDQIGFIIPDEFVIGYGLDYAGKYRNLPYVAVLDPRMYAAE